MKTKDMIICAAFAAMLCIFSVMTIPIGAVPITMVIFGVVLTACILGARRGAAAVAVYILIGTLGLPVFSGFKGGLGVITGPTGGYILGYIPMAIFIGFFTRHLPGNRTAAAVVTAAVSFIGIIICYLFGTLQFMNVTHKDFVSVLSVCVYPFIPLDLAKCAAGAVVSQAVRGALSRAGIRVR